MHTSETINSQSHQEVGAKRGRTAASVRGGQAKALFAEFGRLLNQISERLAFEGAASALEFEPLPPPPPPAKPSNQQSDDSEVQTASMAPPEPPPAVPASLASVPARVVEDHPVDQAVVKEHADTSAGAKEQSEEVQSPVGDANAAVPGTAPLQDAQTPAESEAAIAAPDGELVQSAAPESEIATPPLTESIATEASSLQEVGAREREEKAGANPPVAPADEMAATFEPSATTPPVTGDSVATKQPTLSESIEHTITETLRGNRQPDQEILRQTDPAGEPFIGEERPSSQPFDTALLTPPDRAHVESPSATPLQLMDSTEIYLQQLTAMLRVDTSLQGAANTSTSSRLNSGVQGLSGLATTSPNAPSAVTSDGALGRVANPAQTNEPRATPTLTRTAAVRTLERVERAIKEVAQSKDGKTISVRLDPPDLGTVKVDVSIRDGALHARVVAESSAVTSLLRERAGEMQTILRKLGLNVDRISVSVGGEQQLGQFDQTGERQNGQAFTNSAFARQQEDGSTGVHDRAVPARAKGTEMDHWVA